MKRSKLINIRFTEKELSDLELGRVARSERLKTELTTSDYIREAIAYMNVAEILNGATEDENND